MFSQVAAAFIGDGWVALMSELSFTCLTKQSTYAPPHQRFSHFLLSVKGSW